MRKGYEMKERRMWKNTWLKELAGKYGLEKGKSIIVEERSLLKDYTYITREIRQKKRPSLDAFFIAEGIGKQGRIASLCPKWNPEFALVKIMYLHPALFQSCLPDT